MDKHWTDNPSPHVYMARLVSHVFVLRVCLHSCFGFQDVLDGLARKNHETKLLTSTGAVVQAVLCHDDKVYAQSDPRKGGYAAGYWSYKHTYDYGEIL